MSIHIQQSNQLKVIAILMMLFLHLFNTLDYTGLYEPMLFVGDTPLVYYLSLFCDACVPIFAFVSGYGLYFKYLQNKHGYNRGNKLRLKKLYIHYWVVLLLFAVFLGALVGKEGYPGSWLRFFENFSGLNPSYNGAWWFFTTYVFFVLTSAFWFKVLDTLNPYFLVFILLLLYALAFYFRVYKASLFHNALGNWMQVQLALYFCTLFQFMLGAFALKYSWNSRVSACTQSLPYKSIIMGGGIVLLIVFHAIVPNFVVAPFTGLCFIFLFLQLNLGSVCRRILHFFVPHATTMWLVHMFFYMIYFKDFVYSFHYVPLIYLVVVFLCVVSSLIVNYFNDKIQMKL